MENIFFFLMMKVIFYHKIYILSLQVKYVIIKLIYYFSWWLMLYTYFKNQTGLASRSRFRSDQLAQKDVESESDQLNQWSNQRTRRTDQFNYYYFFQCQNDVVLMFFPSSTFNPSLFQYEATITPPAPRHRLWASPAATLAPPGDAGWKLFPVVGSCKSPSSRHDHPLCKAPSLTPLCVKPTPPPSPTVKNTHPPLLPTHRKFPLCRPHSEQWQ